MGINMGVVYYPEHWPESRWARDVELMKQAGVGRVRLAEFAWSRMEPQEDQFRFDWLDRAIELLGRSGIEVILCTPTAAPPPWLYEKYPDTRTVDVQERLRGFGLRLNRCMHGKGYRERCRRIIERMAKHYAGAAEVIAWQLDNEFGCHDSVRCYCEKCRQAFGQWLRERYAEIARLNEAWGTVFWSHEYNDFSQIPVPGFINAEPIHHNPSLILDFYRFSSDAQVRFAREQTGQLRQANPKWTITTNVMGLFDQIDYFDLSRDLDIVSWDNYPFFDAQERGGQMGPAVPLANDLMRGLKRKNVWVMEQASGPGGWESRYYLPRPGQVRLWAYQAVARGADYVNFFRWRSCRSGVEQFWSGILDHDGEPRKRYDEIKRIGEEMARIDEAMEKTQPTGQVGLLWDYDNLWALQIQPHNVRRPLDFTDVATRFHHGLTAAGIPCEIVSAEADWAGLKVLLIPSLYLCDEKMAAKLKGFVSTGETLILGPRSGVKDLANLAHEDQPPGPLADLAGVRVEDFDVVEMVGNEIRWQDGFFPVECLAELLDLHGAESIAAYQEDFYQGRPGVTCNSHGKGRVYYFGTLPGGDFFSEFFAAILPGFAVEGLTWPPHVEVCRRTGGDGREILFILNHTPHSQSVSLEESFTDLLTGESHSGVIPLPPYEVFILKQH